MALILDSNSEMSVHVWSDLGYLICLRHLFREQSQIIFFKSGETCFPSHMAICFNLPSNISTIALVDVNLPDPDFALRIRLIVLG